MCVLFCFVWFFKRNFIIFFLINVEFLCGTDRTQWICSQLCGCWWCFSTCVFPGVYGLSLNHIIWVVIPWNILRTRGRTWIKRFISLHILNMCSSQVRYFFHINANTFSISSNPSNFNETTTYLTAVAVVRICYQISWHWISFYCLRGSCLTTMT